MRDVLVAARDLEARHELRQKRSQTLEGSRISEPHADGATVCLINSLSPSLMA